MDSEHRGRCSPDARRRYFFSAAFCAGDFSASPFLASVVLALSAAFCAGDFSASPFLASVVLALSAASCAGDFSASPFFASLPADADQSKRFELHRNLLFRPLHIPSRCSKVQEERASRSVLS